MLDRTSKLKISKNIEDLINTIHKLNLLNIYRILCPTVAKYTFLSNSHRTFTKVDYVLGHKTSLKKRKKKILGGSCHASLGIIPLPGIEPMPTIVEAWSLHYWTAREVSKSQEILKDLNHTKHVLRPQ